MSLSLVLVLPHVLIYLLWPTSHLFLPDDAFYYFEIASNVHDGHGSTFDRINPTNGYHPLWLLMLSIMPWPAAARELSVSLVMVFQSVLMAATLIVAQRTLCRRVDSRTLIVFGLIAAGLSWNYYLSKLILNGMESALYLFLTAYTLHRFGGWLLDGQGMTLKRSAALGFLAGLVILSRLDGVFYLIAVPAIWLANDAGGPRPRWRGVLLFLTVAGALVLAYMISSQVLFGIPMPVSGYIKRVVRTPGPSLALLLGYLAYTGAVLLGVRIALGRFVSRPGDRLETVVMTLSLFLLLHMADSMLINGVFPWSAWHLTPHFYWILLMAYLTVARIRTVRRVPFRRAILFLAALLAFAAVSLSWRLRLNEGSFRLAATARSAALWINDTLPAATVLGGWDCGRVGYYAVPSVINLDGLVNSLELARHLRRATGVDYLRGSPIEYIVQYIPARADRITKKGYDPYALSQRMGAVVWSRRITINTPGLALRTGRFVSRELRFNVWRTHGSGSP